MIKSIIIVSLGGALGAVVRMGLTAMVWGPLGTLLVNCLGCFGLGLCLNLIKGKPELLLLVQIGFFGAMTTFSTFAVDALRLPSIKAISYVTASVVLGLVFLILGQKLAEKVFS